MNEIRTAVLQEMKSSTRIWSFVYSVKVFVWVLWIASCVFALTITHGALLTLSLQLLLGAAFAHGVELQHQALHLSGFRSAKVSRTVGVFLGMPMLVSFSSYQDSHLFHHQQLGTPNDSEFFVYGDKSERRVGTIFKHFFLINHFCSFLKNVIDAASWQKFETKLIQKNATKIRFEYLLMGSCFFGSAGLSSHFHNDYFFRIWTFPLFFFAAPIHALIELPEHFGCAKDTTDVFSNTRTIKTHRVATWFTNGNNYHVEHHCLASLPVEKLASVHQKVSDRIVYSSPSYWSFYRQFFSTVFFSKTKADQSFNA